MAPDVVDHNKIIFGEPDEPGAAFEGIRQQLAAFGEFRMRADVLVAEGDTVVARVTAPARTPGPIRGCPGPPAGPSRWSRSGSSP
ncbi:ester cyclase [Streptomyces sp. AV19]|uniref:ester cyclase n=1 Tax=Streptomyces sp. AV19 TaxID=2793068 RepID=UPI001F29DA64|nr:ester cyclase [Streptomyces sp. AV19]MDG4536498.1 ester cyclase [Streptomyces sp. AV19]